MINHADYLYFFLEVDTQSATFDKEFVRLIAKNPQFDEQFDRILTGYIGTRETYERFCAAFGERVDYSRQPYPHSPLTPLYLDNLSHKDFVRVIDENGIETPVTISQNLPDTMIPLLVERMYSTTHPVIGKITKALLDGIPISLAQRTDISDMYVTEYLLNTDVLYNIKKISPLPKKYRLIPHAYSYLHKPAEFLSAIEKFRDNIRQEDIDECFTNVYILTGDKENMKTFRPNGLTVDLLLRKYNYDMRKVVKELGGKRVVRKINATPGSLTAQFHSAKQLMEFLDYPNLVKEDRPIWLNYVTMMHSSLLPHKRKFIADTVLTSFAEVCGSMFEWNLLLEDLVANSVKIPHIIDIYAVEELAKKKDWDVNRLFVPFGVRYRLHPATSKNLTIKPKLQEHFLYDKTNTLPSDTEVKIRSFRDSSSYSISPSS